jgi:hypothetical protein
MLLLVIVLVWIGGGYLSLMRARKNVEVVPRSKAYLQVSRSLCLESLISLGL